MLSKNAIKFVNSLKIKKYRLEHQAFIVEGEKSVAELLSGRFRVSALYCLESWFRENPDLLKMSGAEIILITAEELSRISDLTTPNRVLAVAALPENPGPGQLNFEEMILALDGIRDPGNMGTILRTADWFGIRQLVCSPDCVDVFNPKVVQATMGSFARVSVFSMEIIKLINYAPENTPVFGALLQGPSLSSRTFTKAGILIIGNESRGISAPIIPFITDPVFIPSFTGSNAPSTHAESLNASVANAIICYEIRKQLSENKF